MPKTPSILTAIVEIYVERLALLLELSEDLRGALALEINAVVDDHYGTRKV